MKKNIFLLFIIALFTGLVSLACTIFIGGPAYPRTAVVISTEAVGNFEMQLQAAQTAAVESGIITLTINESQITSLLAQKLDSQTNPIIQDPQVYLRNDEIQVYGKAYRGNFEANVRVVLKASVNTEGKPELIVSSVDFGPLPAPQGLNEVVSGLIDQAFAGSFGPAAIGIRLESINIANGVMTISGRVK